MTSRFLLAAGAAMGLVALVPDLARAQAQPQPAPQPQPPSQPVVQQPPPAAPEPSAPAPGQSLRLEDAVRLSLKNNERSLRSPLRVKAAEGQVDRARSGFLPTLVVDGGGALSANLNRANRHTAADTALTVNQPLLNLTAVPQLQQARRLLESERWGAIEDRRVLSFDTARSFLVVLMAENVVQVSRQRLERARANQKNAEVRAQAQLASTNDVSRALLDTATAARDLAQVEGQLARSYLDLGFLVGQPVPGPLAAPDRTTQAAQNAALVGEPAAREAESRRPDVRSATERTAALRFFAQEPLYRLIPVLGLTGQLTAMTVGPTEPVHNETVALNLTWTLFDAGVRYADRKTRVAQAEIQALDERMLRRSVRTAVGLALASLKAARAAFRISEEAVAAAQKSTQETEVLYKQGLARAIELVDANTRRFEAEVGRVTAKLAMEQAYLELRFALGLGPVGDESDPARADGGTP